MAHSQPISDSRLPVELERKIFEIAAYCDPIVVLDLILVAWRVKLWVEPLFYRVIFLDASGSPIFEGLPRFTVAPLLRLIDEKRKEILANARHLIIQDPPHVHGVSPSHLRRLNAIMRACTGVTHLFLHSNKKLELHELDALAGMPALRVLGVHISKLFKRASVNLTHPVFRNITHLEC
ncbi:hypothetical protein B0H19DRAFT_1252013 [Mycena capillaripes]|nr:hypothetical protein B0H19DRAFT_1252013 [Mycena capillaripes]